MILDVLEGTLSQKSKFKKVFWSSGEKLSKNKKQTVIALCLLITCWVFEVRRPVTLSNLYLRTKDCIVNDTFFSIDNQ